MKNLFLSLLVLIIPFLGIAQSTEIRPGNILPKMTSSQRNAIVSPADGMLVFDSNTQSYWYRKTGTWTELPQSTAAVNFWQQTGAGGNEIKNTNSGGFWSENPVGLTGSTNNVSNPPAAPLSGAGTRIMWIPSRSAFRVGTLFNEIGNESTYWNAANIGLNSFALGTNTKASGYNSIAMGFSNTASADHTLALGYRSTASAYASTAMGNFTSAGGLSSTAMGNNTNASGENSTAMGESTTASGKSSTAMGRSTNASNLHATAMGVTTTASGIASTAMGQFSTASGDYSTAMGYDNLASGDYSTAIGTRNIASGLNSTAMGERSIASNYHSFAAGSSVASGIGSTAFGTSTIASGLHCFAMGRYNIDNPDGLFMVGNGYYGARNTIFLIRSDNYRVGIGTETPLAPLHVSGYDNVSTGVGHFFYKDAGLSTYPSYTANISIYADNGIVAGTYVGAAVNVISSDSRIKNIKGLSNNAKDLAKLKQIEITDYTMKDEVTWGSKNFKKVIAQQVEEVYPEVIKRQTSVIPDIYTLAQKVSYNASTKELTVSMAKNYELKIGDKVELVHPEKGKVQSTITSISGNTFTVKDWLYETDKIFVFGREVSDFRTVDYDALSMLGISAIQALAKENEELKNLISELKLKAEIKNEKTEARLEKLESLLLQISSVNSETKTVNK